MITDFQERETMNSVSPENRNELWKLLFETSEAVRNCYERERLEGTRKELTLSQLRVMSCIFLNESRSVRIKDISEELGITAGGVSQSVDALVQAGFLTRCRDTKDRRAVAVTFSEYGERVRQDVYNSFSDIFSQFMAGISHEKQEIFHDVLKHILENARKKGKTTQTASKTKKQK